MNMKGTFLTILLIFFSQLFGQNISEINKAINISDSLTNEEIRVYKSFEGTNGSEVFRMYKIDRNNWTVELYKYFKSIDNNHKSKFEMSKLTSKTDLNLVWLYILACDVEFLPNIKDIDYKLKGKAEIVLDRGEYYLSNRKIKPLDGNGYKAFFKDIKKKNNFDFRNFDSYLEEYPDVDELDSYSKLVNVIQKEFGIWSK